MIDSDSIKAASEQARLTSLVLSAAFKRLLVNGSRHAVMLRFPFLLEGGKILPRCFTNDHRQSLLQLKVSKIRSTLGPFNTVLGVPVFSHNSTSNRRLELSIQAHEGRSINLPPLHQTSKICRKHKQCQSCNEIKSLVGTKIPARVRIPFGIATFEAATQCLCQSVCTTKIMKPHQQAK